LILLIQSDSGIRRDHIVAPYTFVQWIEGSNPSRLLTLQNQNKDLGAWGYAYAFDGDFRESGVAADILVAIQQLQTSPNLGQPRF
jgi:hypothetical protein